MPMLIAWALTPLVNSHLRDVICWSGEPESRPRFLWEVLPVEDSMPHETGPSDPLFDTVSFLKAPGAVE